MFKVSNPTTIVFPSDIKIKVKTIKDKDGNVVPKNSIYIMFMFVDRYGAEYFATYDPSGEKSEHVVYNSTDDTLDILIENYRLRGQIFVKVGTKSVDTSFSDGKWDWWTAPEMTNITIIN